MTPLAHMYTPPSQLRTAHQPVDEATGPSSEDTPIIEAPPQRSRLGSGASFLKVSGWVLAVLVEHSNALRLLSYVHVHLLRVQLLNQMSAYSFLVHQAKTVMYMYQGCMYVCMHFFYRSISRVLVTNGPSSSQIRCSKNCTHFVCQLEK